MKPSILSVLELNTGCSWVRMIHPFKYLKKNGYQALIVPQHEVTKMLKFGIPDHNIFVASRRVPRPDKVDEMIAHINILKSRGVKVVYEIDDDPFSTRFAENYDDIKKVLPHYDAIIVSTRKLASRVEDYCRPYVFRNYVDHELWDAFPDFRVPEKITIGISGSPTHYDDWLVVAEPLHKIAKKHQHVHFLSFGYTPDYLADLPRLERVDPVPYNRYPSHLKRMDIGLAPLNNDEFNLYKSEVKVLDYGLAGALPIASDHPVYRQTEAGVLVKPDEWYDVLDYFVTNINELRDRQARAEKWVRKNRTLAKGWRELLNVYKHILRD